MEIKAYTHESNKKVTITIPKNNLNERKYIINILFDEFLGLEYEILISEVYINAYIIEFNKHKLIIKDYFFNDFSKNLSYLESKNIPSHIKFTQNNFIVEKNIPILFGTDLLEIRDENITCGIDIFASSFFMLTRWEEYINKTRDKHERFPSYASLAYKYNFLDRPIVNEYLEMLWNMLTHLGITQNRKKRIYNLIPTHDVDFPLRYFSTRKVIKEVARDVIKNKIIKKGFLKLQEYILIKFRFKTDPYDTFDFMINLEKKAGLESYFFFMGEGTSPMYDDNYEINNPYIKNLIKKIILNGHKVGIHPSYVTYNNKEQLLKEKELIQRNTDIDIKYGRQHYLRFEIPTTWQNWEDNAMIWDTTLSYADKEGFRCGVCYEYSVLNILTRKKLNLKEKPLIMMEGSFFTYQPSISTEEMEYKIMQLINKVKKYQGDFVFLWHNSSFDGKLNAYSKVYESIIHSHAK
jgi:peptidoglycan/xylan/chitin deacetylase (PgdA/CDA1 family)